MVEASRSGRKTREERLASLKKTLSTLEKQRDKLNEDIKSTKGQINEIETYYLLQDAEKIKGVAAKHGVSVSDVVKAIEQGKITPASSGTPGSNSGAGDSDKSGEE